jgi:CDP-diacylglycerol--serine O-phosphatidyltransferase
MKLFTIPNLMTLGNLLCGCLGIIATFEGNLLMASYLIFVAGILDFLDGFVARAINSSSPIGKELDSLADVVTFGVLPALMLMFLIEKTAFGTMNGDFFQLKTSYVALLIALFSALRLAKFNIDTRQSESFIGVPTPANAIVVASFPLILEFNSAYAPIILNSAFLIAYTLIMSYLLIAELPLFALKFKNFSWADNKIKFIFLILSVILLIIFGFLAIPLIVFLYIILSLVNIFLIK